MPKPRNARFDARSCGCGGPAKHEVAEVISTEVSRAARAPLSAFLCHDHFCQLMAHAMYEALADGGDRSHQSALPTASISTTAQHSSPMVGELPQQNDRPGAHEPMLVSVKDARKLLGLGHTTIYKLIAAGDLRVVRVGGRTLLETASLRDFIAKSRILG